MIQFEEKYILHRDVAMSFVSDGDIPHIVYSVEAEISHSQISEIPPEKKNVFV